MAEDKRVIKGNKEVLDLVKRMQEIDREMAVLKNEKAEGVEMLKAYLGNEMGSIKYGGYILASWKPRKSFSQSLLHEKYPEIYDECTVEQENGTFTISKSDLSKIIVYGE